MSTVILHSVASVDGFIADGGDEPYDHSGSGSRFAVSRPSADYVRTTWASIATSR